MASSYNISKMKGKLPIKGKLPMGRVLKYFSRNEYTISESSNVVSNDRSLSSEIVKQAAEHHEGSKIYKQKVKDMPSKAPVSPDKVEKWTTTSFKNAFVKFLTKGMTCQPDPTNSPKKNRNSMVANNKVNQFLIKIRDEESNEDLKTIWTKIKEIQPLSNTGKNKDFQDIDFWNKKGYMMSQEGNINNAIDYYMQGVKLYSKSFVTWFNLGWVYNKVNKRKLALNWFAKAHLADPDRIEPFYAISVVCYRSDLNKISCNFALLWLADDTIDEEMKTNARYLAAISNKQGGNIKVANDFYSALAAEIDKKERKELTKYTWGLLLLPLIENRKTKVTNIENLYKLTMFYSVENPEDKFTNVYDFKNKMWLKESNGYDIIYENKLFR
jgi:tetratricopeptide (TPR) repeat protein